MAPQPMDSKDINMMFSGRRGEQNCGAAKVLIDRDGMKGFDGYILRESKDIDSKLTVAIAIALAFDQLRWEIEKTDSRHLR